MEQSDAAQKITKAVRGAFHEEARLGPKFELDRIDVEGDGILVLEGRVACLAQKKLALLRAAAVPGVIEIIDRMHVAVAGFVRDRHIRAQMREMFAQDANFSSMEVREDLAEGVVAIKFEEVAGATVGAAGRIDIEVNDGVVTLNGIVPTLIHKRLAGAMAWWVPGVCDVINGIAVEPEEEDGPDQVEEAVRVVLDRDPAVNASQIRVGVRGHVVRLTGLVGTNVARERAENNAWAIFGVDDVVNKIEVRP